MSAYMTDLCMNDKFVIGTVTTSSKLIINMAQHVSSFGNIILLMKLHAHLFADGFYLIFRQTTDSQNLAFPICNGKDNFAAFTTSSKPVIKMQ